MAIVGFRRNCPKIMQLYVLALISAFAVPRYGGVLLRRAHLRFQSHTVHLGASFVIVFLNLIYLSASNFDVSTYLVLIASLAITHGSAFRPPPRFPQAMLFSGTLPVVSLQYVAPATMDLRDVA